MLEYLYIENFTIAEKIEIDFQAGMTVITGETGAGKSLIMEALSILLGERFEKSMQRNACATTIITASFSIKNNPNAQSWLQESGLAKHTDCLLRRVINPEGRSRAFVNDIPVSLQQLKQGRLHLLDMHRQHEHYRLLNRDYQRQQLDDYGKLAPLQEKVRTSYHLWREIKLRIAQLQQVSVQSDEMQLLQYQLEELNNLGLAEHEYDALVQEHKQLSHSEEIERVCATTMAWLANDEETAILALLHRCQHHLQQQATVFPALQNTIELLDQAKIQLQEAAQELRANWDQVQRDPERLQQVEQRLQQIHDVARKHHVPANALPQLTQELQHRLHALENTDQDLQKQQQQLAQQRLAYQAHAETLRAARQQVATELAETLIPLLPELGLANCKFDVQVTPLEKADPQPEGMDQVEFFVRMNPGSPPLPLAKVASGGELSRLSLALEVCLRVTATPITLLFDEVDVGIGGATAARVGRVLKTLAEQQQVICITHQPQVAAAAHYHLLAKKTVQQQQTYAVLQILDETARQQELARMLGGQKISNKALAHAKELLTSLA